MQHAKNPTRTGKIRPSQKGANRISGDVKVQQPAPVEWPLFPSDTRLATVQFAIIDRSALTNGKNSVVVRSPLFADLID
jgi:hypothetical protein